jgi:hypothetical protein
MVEDIIKQLEQKWVNKENIDFEKY